MSSRLPILITFTVLITASITLATLSTPDTEHIRLSDTAIRSRGDNDSAQLVNPSIVWNPWALAWTTQINIGANDSLAMILNTSATDVSVVSSNCTNPACFKNRIFPDNSDPRNATAFPLMYNDTMKFTNTSHKDQGQLGWHTFSASANPPPEWVKGSVSGTLPFSACNSSSPKQGNCDQLSILKSEPFWYQASPNSGRTHLAGLDFRYNGGKICLGCVDPSAYNVSLGIEYWPLRTDRPDMREWQVPNLTALWDNGTRSATIDAVITTSFKGIYAPNQTVHEFYANVTSLKVHNGSRGDQYYLMSCKDMPKLAFHWSDSLLDWPVILGFNMSMTTNITSACRGPLMTLTDESVFKTKSPGNSTEVWLLGFNFLTNVYAVFDLDNQRFGVGKRQLALNMTSV